MLQENNDITASALALSSLSSQGSPTPSSPSSFTHEYDTSNCFSRLPNETIFTILAFSITTQTSITTATSTVFSPHKQLTVLSQVCQLFNKIANDVLLWQIAFEAKFDSEAIIRAGIIDYNVIDDSFGSFGSFGVAEGKGKGEGHTVTTTQIQNSSSFEQIQTGGNIWKELYKERQIALNKIKNYTLPSPFVYNNNNNNNNNNSENDDTSTNAYLDDFDDFMVENENDNENFITNNRDSSTLESTDQVDDDVDYLYDLDFNFVGSESNETQSEEIERDILDFSFEDNEFRFQELGETLENNVTYTIGNTVKGDAVKEDTPKEDIPKEDVSKDVLKEDIVKEEPPKQNIMQLNLEDNLEYAETNNTSAANADGDVQDFSFVSEGFDPELDSVFPSDTIGIDSFVSIENEEIDTQNDEVLVKDTHNSAKEVDHVVQAQNLSSLKSNGDLDEYESYKLPGYEEKTSKPPNHENFDQDKPQLQGEVESSTRLQDFGRDESKLQKGSLIKLSDKNDSLLKEELPDYDENEEVFQFYDYDESITRTNLHDHNVNEELSQIENSSKEIVNEQENDLPAYDENEEITNLLDFDYEIKTSQNVIIENNNSNVPDYIENERENDINDNVVNENDDDIEQENIEENRSLINNEKQPNNGLQFQDYEEKVKEINLSNGNVIIEQEDEDINDNEDIQSNHDENEVYEYSSENDVDIEEMTDYGEIYQGLNNPFIFAVNNNQVLEFDWVTYGNIQSRRKRRKIIRQNDDPELLKTLNVIWKICQENDGMNSEVLLGSNVKELVVNLIQSLDKMETQTECLSIALQILSILVSWHPELTIDLHKNNLFWTTIHYVMNYIDIFFPELENNLMFKQLVLPASAGSAIHIFFHTNFFNLSNPNEFIDNYIPPPQLIPDSNIFNNVYGKSELKPGEGIIQPFEEDLSGKWCGYYAYFLPRPIRESAMDITSLEFSPSEPGKVYYLNLIDNSPVPVIDKVVKEFSGTGIDQIGEFVIKHGIITEKGNVNFIKTHTDKDSWIYDGILLPVGICGRWGTSSEWNGNFWIWKR